MIKDKQAEVFFTQYSEDIQNRALLLREVIFSHLPDIIEQFDLPAKIVGYCYGQKYSELICVIIPSKKGLKLGFNQGTKLPDPHKLLEGTGKISRYIVITSEDQIHSAGVKELLANALVAYRQRMSLEDMKASKPKASAKKKRIVAF